MTTNIFEFATRNKLRFPFKGQISVEDLWELPLKSLDAIFKTLSAQVKQAKEESLLETKTAEDTVLEVQIAIIRHIVSVKQEEKKLREQAAENKAQRERIMSIIADKKDEALKNSSIEELEKMLADIG